jgi:aryl-alcohol dehydrogenase-like predicted oxidoreductase
MKFSLLYTNHIVCNRIKTLPWSPLAGGQLAGKNRDTDRSKMRPAYTAEEDIITDRVVEVAAKKGVPAAQVALAWVLSKDVVSSPIIGVRKESHLVDCIQALEVNITEEEAKYLEEPYKPRTPVGHN